MPEILQVADKIQVLRRGKRVKTYKASDASIEELVGAMTGKFEDTAA
jgi:simple sugar transport system ATP-binding protein